MPCYPALALLLGSAMAARTRGCGTAPGRLRCGHAGGGGHRRHPVMVRDLATPGDIAGALSQNPESIRCRWAHDGLTLRAFAYLRLPLAVAGCVCGGAAGPGVAPDGGWCRWRRWRHDVLFFHAARLAMVVFDPYLSSRPLAEALLQAPPGKLIVDDQYYTFSSFSSTPTGVRCC